MKIFKIYICYFSLFICIVIIVIITIIIVIIIIKFYVVTICFIFYGARLGRGLEVWQISGDVKNKRDGGNHEVYIYYFF